MQLFNFNGHTRPVTKLASIAMLLYCGASYGVSTNTNKPLPIDNTLNHPLTQKTTAVEVSTSADSATANDTLSKNVMKQNNVCRVVRGSYLADLSAEPRAKGNVLDTEKSNFQQRIYRTRVGQLTRPSLRNHSVNYC